MLIIYTPQSIKSTIALCACVCVCVCVCKYTHTLIQLVKNPVANPGDPRDASSSPMLGRSPGEGNGNSNILA